MSMLSVWHLYFVLYLKIVSSRDSMVSIGPDWVACKVLFLSERLCFRSSHSTFCSAILLLISVKVGSMCWSVSIVFCA